MENGSIREVDNSYKRNKSMKNQSVLIYNMFQVSWDFSPCT